MTRLAAVAFALAALVSCGPHETESVASRTVNSTTRCADAGAHGTRRYLVCATTTALHNGVLVVEEGGLRRVLRVPLPDRYGQWKWAAVSPDGRWLLAQLAADCETSKVFFVPARGGRTWPAAAEDGYALESKAYGWTTDGRAIVWFPARAGCASGIGREGIYLVRPGGRPAFWRTRAPTRSVMPRDLG
jgi:hypothetical protein